MPFKKIGLKDQLVQAVLDSGYTTPTPIQSQAIPEGIEGRDVIGCAQTGTGKTAAFVLPLLHRLSHTESAKKPKTRALILTPTRELAVQVDEAITEYGRHLDLTTLAIYGGVNMQKQLKRVKRGIDIVVATPGRLIDHLQRGTVNLNSIEILVVDEADRMFDMGFIKDVRKILDKLPRKRQTMMFSATMSKEVNQLAEQIMTSPKVIQIGAHRNPVETVDHHIYPVAREQKMDLLVHILENSNIFNALVFSRTKHGADRIARNLSKTGIKAATIHSDRSQSQRQRALKDFKAGKFRVMVATDIAARGIDIDGLSHVINFDVPAYPEDYIHRIGRTGRAESTGDAITFVSTEEADQLTKIEKFINRSFELVSVDGFNYKKTKVKPKKTPPRRPAGKSFATNRKPPSRKRRR